MVTRRKYSPQEIRKDSSYFSPLKAIIETAFYENQVVAIKTVEEAYQLASAAAGTCLSFIQRNWACLLMLAFY